MKKYLFVFSAFSFFLSGFVFAQTNCSTLASLTLTTPFSKTAYLVGEPISGANNVVFTNNTAPVPIVFNVSVAKDGQVILSKLSFVQAQLGRNAWSIKDAFGVDTLPSAGTYTLSITASYAPPGCTWNANLQLTAIGPPQIDSLNPSSSVFGSTITVNGSGFTPTGNNVKSSSVVIGLNISSSDGRTLTFTVPDVSPGVYPILVQNTNGTSNEISFTVAAAKPEIQSLEPSSAQPYTQISVNGVNFTRTGNDVKSGSLVIASGVPSNGTVLNFTVPDVSPGAYPISVSNKRGVSNEVSFTVLAPPPVKLLTSLAILPPEYLLGQTVTGSVTLTNPTTKEIKADFSIELYKDTVLFWQRQINGLSIPPSLGAAPQVLTIPLETIFGFKPTIPDNPSFVGNWKLVIKRTDAGPTVAPDDSVSQTFTIKAPIIQPLTLTFNFDPKEYILGDTLKGKGAVANPGSLPVKADFKIELFQETTLKWQREIKDISIPAGTAKFTVDDLFGFKVVIPNEVSLIGDWKLKITQLGTTPEVSVEAAFKIQGLTAACKPTTGTPEEKIFGIVKGWFPWNTEQRDLDSMKEAGLKWTRVEISWAQIEKQKGQFDWNFYDTVIKNLDDNNIRILAQLETAPSWANGQIGKKFNDWYPPTDLNDWANFVRKAVNRYKPGGEIALKNPVIYWEIWNEPNALPFWQPAPDVAKYIQLLAVSNKAIREIDPRAIIVGISEAGTDPFFTSAIYKAGAKNCFDVISLHPYGSVQDLKPKTEAIKKFLVDHNDANKPIWYTEYGFETGPGKGTTEAQQAEYLKQTYELFSRGLVPAFFWIGLRDEPPSMGDFTFGILRSDFSKKPAFDVLKNLLNPQVPRPVTKQVWFAPTHWRNDFFDLFRKPELWSQARSKIQVLQFYERNEGGGIGWGGDFSSESEEYSKAMQLAINYLLSRGYSQKDIDTYLPKIISGEIKFDSLPFQIKEDLRKAYDLFYKILQEAWDSNINYASSRIKDWGLDVSIEAGKPLVYGNGGVCNQKNAVEIAPALTKQTIEKIQKGGATVRYLTMDEPFQYGTKVYAFPGAPSFPICDIDKAAFNVAQYINVIKKDYPAINFGDTEPYIPDVAYPWPATNEADLENWVLALERQGIYLSFLNIDIYYPGIKDIQKTIDDLKKLRAFLESRNIQFGMVFVGSYPGDPKGVINPSEIYYKHAIDVIKSIKSLFGQPQHIIFQSWASDDKGRGIPINLPENNPAIYSHTRLINEGLRILEAK